MLGEDKKSLEAAKILAQRYHFGPLGQVLQQRFLDHCGAVEDDFSLIELEPLWQTCEQRAAIPAPAPPPPML